MTFKERLQRELPTFVNEKWWGGCKSCPDSYGYEDYSECDGTGGNCEACWNREIPEVEKS